MPCVWVRFRSIKKADSEEQEEKLKESRALRESKLAEAKLALQQAALEAGGGGAGAGAGSGGMDAAEMEEDKKAIAAFVKLDSEVDCLLTFLDPISPC